MKGKESDSVPLTPENVRAEIVSCQHRTPSLGHRRLTGASHRWYFHFTLLHGEQIPDIEPK